MQIARPRDLAGNDDLLFRETRFEREFRGLQRRDHHAVVDDFFG